MFDQIFQKIHISTFIGVDCYFTGVLAEMLTRNKTVREVISKTIAFKILFYISIPLQIALIASGAYFMSELGTPSLTYAIYAAIVKKIWAFSVAILIIGCMQSSECEKYVNFVIFIDFFKLFLDCLKKFFNGRLSILLGKLTFIVFLIHIVVGEAISTNIKQPFILSDLHLVRKNIFLS